MTPASEVFVLIPLANHTILSMMIEAAEVQVGQRESMSYPRKVLIIRVGRRRHCVRAVLYGLQVFYSYLLMLVAMTYQVLSYKGLRLIIGACSYCYWDWCGVGVLFLP
jgi:hypothetical protein